MKLPRFLIMVFALCFSGLTFAQSPDKKPFAGFAVGVTGALAHGEHTIDLEVLGYKTSIADDTLSGSSLGLSFEYLYPISNWRVGPRLKLERGSYKANDRIGNKYVNFETSLELEEMHSLSLLVGYVATPRLMPYGFVGVGVSHGTIGARLNVLKYSVSDSSTGWVAGPTYGVGILYRLSKHSELGLEYSLTDMEKRYEKCAKILPQLCAAVPVAIRPRTVSVTYQYRF